MVARIQKISKYAPSIFQGRLEFAAMRGNLAESVSLTSEHSAERAIFRALACSLLALALLYIYFVGASILNIIARKEANADSDRMATAVSVLEREYFVQANGITSSDAGRYGLTSLTNTAYVYRPGNAALAGQNPNAQAAVTIRSNEI